MMGRRSRTSTGASPSRAPKRLRRSERLRSMRARRDAKLGGGDESGRIIVVSETDFLEKNKALAAVEVTEESQLRAAGLDLHLKENRSAHHTDEYEQLELIVRRGQVIDLTVKFDREFKIEEDTVIVQFVTGSRPKESKGTVIRLKVTDAKPDGADDWHAFVKSQDGASLKIGVVTSSDAIIGHYRIFVETETERDDGTQLQHRREFEETMCVIFNPWCKDDLVYLSQESDRKEYVLNEVGNIWIGSARVNHGRPWNFGQFEDVCLEASLYLLDKAELADGARSNPVLVTRCLSAMANSNDEDGVLEGRWSSTYPKDSTVPWAWAGSVAILDQYMKSKKAVQFGQCWVFSGLITTLCRSLGIPTRSVTNFESAHDCDGSMTIDYHWNEDNEPLTDLDDSVWNFHVWNESYMKRPDLPSGYDGWQAFDATPQELSEGVMQCGPAPVQAVKEGRVYFPYDTPFIFAEVNGDRVHWLCKNDGSMEVIYKQTATVGLNISTKAVGTPGRQDLGPYYKFQEGSEEERKSVHRAFRFSSRREHQIYNIPQPDVSFELIAPDNVVVGEDFELLVKMKNQSQDERTVTAKLTAVVSFYTGVPSEKVGAKAWTQTLAANAEIQEVVPIGHQDYEALLKPDSMVTVYLKGSVHETKRSYAGIESFGLIKPNLTVQAPEQAVLSEPFDVTLKLKNPLGVKLNAGVFHIEAAGITHSLTLPYKKSIGAGEEISHTVTLTPNRAGDRVILVSFSSDQLSGLHGDTSVYVSYPQ